MKGRGEVCWQWSIQSACFWLRKELQLLSSVPSLWGIPTSGQGGNRRNIETHPSPRDKKPSEVATCHFVFQIKTLWTFAISKTFSHFVPWNYEEYKMLVVGSRAQATFIDRNVIRMELKLSKRLCSLESSGKVLP